MGGRDSDLLGFSERFLRPEFAALEEERRRGQPRWGRFFGALFLLLVALGVVRAFAGESRATNLLLGLPVALAVLGGAVKVLLLSRAWRRWQSRVGHRILAPLAQEAFPAIGLQFPPAPGFDPVPPALFEPGERLRDEARWTGASLDLRVGELRSNREDGGYGPGGLLTVALPEAAAPATVRRRTGVDRVVGLLAPRGEKSGHAGFDDAFVLRGPVPAGPVLDFMVALSGRWNGGLSLAREGGRAWLLLRGRPLLWTDLRDFHRPLEERAFLERVRADLELLEFLRGFPR